MNEKKGITLFIFEGQKTEDIIFNSIKNNVLFPIGDSQNICGSYGNNIYNLWEKIAGDEIGSIDVFSIIKTTYESNPNFKKEEKWFEKINRDSISEIYLYFDYDGHDSRASDEKLSKMLDFFNEETENGKLYISYPMVEALKHLKQGILFQDTTARIADNMNYKERVSKETDYTDFRKLDWELAITEHIKKANYLINGNYELPNKKQNLDRLTQQNIFNNQLEKYINFAQKVAVLSAFPFFLVEYFDENYYNKITGKS